MQTVNNVELNEDGLPKVTWFSEFASRHLNLVLAIFFYIMPLTLGLKFDYFFSQSPLVDFVGKTGMISSAIAWLPAYLFFGIVIGNWLFAKKIFLLYLQHDFSIATALVFLMLPFAKIITLIINRLAYSYLLKKIMFCFILICNIACFVFAYEYIKNLFKADVYLFACSVLGLIYLAFFGRSKKNRRSRLSAGANQNINNESF